VDAGPSDVHAHRQGGGDVSPRTDRQ
jgi:hypothetical protein